MWQRMWHLLAVLFFLCASLGRTVLAGDLKIAKDIEARRAQFMQQELTANTGHLSDGDRKALEHLIRAADIMDEIFLRQAWERNPEFEKKVIALTGPQAAAARAYYRIMYVPTAAAQLR